MTTNNNKVVQLACTINANDEVTFGNYKLIDQNGNQVSSNDSWLDQIINNDLSGVVVDTLKKSLEENGIQTFSGPLFIVNIAISALQNFKETGDNGYKDGIVNSINTAVEIGVATAYGFVGGATGLAGGPITSVAGAVSFSYFANNYYNNNIEPGFVNFLNKGYDYLFNSDVKEKTITYNPTNSTIYEVQSGDTLSQIAQSLGITTQKLISFNPWLESEDRISDNGNYILIRPGEKLSVPTSEIKNSVKLEDVDLKNQDGSSAGSYSNFFLDYANNNLLTNTDLSSNWQIKNPNDISNLKIEFKFDDFNETASKVFGTQAKNWNGISLIDNSFLNLDIRTDKLQGFSSDNNSLGQTGTVIGDADWSLNIPTINFDGLKNVLPGAIGSDGLRPGNQELSEFDNFANQIKNDIDRMSKELRGDYSSTLNFKIQAPTIDLTNAAIGARNFLNIDPVVLDLNGDGVKLTSYNDSEVTFDVDNDGKQERTGWVTPQDGILVEDQNNNGKIDNITETISEYYKLQGSNWVADADGKYSTDGLAALKKLDSNNDGKFNNQDAKWNDLKIWQDANGDAQTDVEELKTLTEAGIKEIDLSNITKANKERNEGNIIFSKTTYTTTDNQVKQIAAVDFTTNPIGYEFNDVNLGKLATAEDGTKSLVISNSNGETVVAGSDTAQNIFGNIGNDSITGDDRDNWISGSAGSDVLKGGKGDDILIIDAEDKQENIDGGEGRDIVIINSDKDVTFNLTQANVETAIGGNGDDVLIGGGNSNVFIDGGSGDDIIIGGAADDALSGSDGDDYVDGGYGDDVVRGHRGNDVLIGGEGNDYLEGGLDDDKVFGGVGNDVIMEAGGNDEIDGGEGYDLVKYNGSYKDYKISRDGFNYKVQDLKSGNIDSIKNIEGVRFNDVTVKLVDGNISPMPVADLISLQNKSDTVFIAKNDLLKNDLDVEGDELTIISVQNFVGGAAKLVKSSSGETIGVEWTPDESFIGNMSFDYDIKDSKGAYAIITQQNSDGTSQTAAMKARVTFKLDSDPTDDLYAKQWYLSEINVQKAWEDYSGEGVKIGIFEKGDFNINHQELDANTLQSYKDDVAFREVSQYSQHKTTVAGVIAAEKNGAGIVGVAYDAKLDGYSWENDDSGLNNLKNVDIANNSWGMVGEFIDNFSDPNNPYSSIKNDLESAARLGRDGLGTVTVFAGGNSRSEGDNVNYHNLQNSRFVITTGSINQPGDLATLTQASTPFSNPGDAILVSAPGSNINSTGNLLTNENGSQFLGEFSSSQGTSFSAPIVSGVVALMLQANPNLGYRDVQKILALSAREFNDPNTTWQENGATNWNGGAMHFSHDYGFGIVNAAAAVRLAETWNEQSTYYNEKYYSASDNNKTLIIDNGTLQKQFTISNSNIHNIETVEVEVNLSDLDISDLTIKLISPNGTESILMDKPASSVYDGGLFFNFSSRAFFGENVDGDWKLQITDSRTGDVSYLNSWKLKFYGDLDDGKNDVYVYTDEFAKMTDGARALIVDIDGGIDTINAAAVSGDTIINLNAGQISKIAGHDVLISGGTPGEEYYQKQAILPSKETELAAKSSLLISENQSLVSKNIEFTGIDAAINAKAIQANQKYAEAEAASTALNAEWASGYTLWTSFREGGTTFYIFKSKANGEQVALSENEANQKINSYNSAVDLFNQKNAEFNALKKQYDDLVVRRELLPSEIGDLVNEVNDLSNQVIKLQSEVNFIKSYLNSFNSNSASEIENAYSGDGNDTIIGSNSDNKIWGGRGNNTLTGNGGADTFIIKENAGTIDTITDFKIGEDKIDLSDFGHIPLSALTIIQNGANSEIIFASGQKIILQNVNSQNLSNSFIGVDGNDVMVGTSGDNIIHGGYGDDEIHGGYGNDTLYGDEGNDKIYGEFGNDTIYGGSGNDIINSGDGNNKLYAEDGDDTIILENNSNDVFTGNGRDTIVVKSNFYSGTNIIEDFNASEDKIDLSSFNGASFNPIKDFSDLVMRQDGGDIIIDLSSSIKLLIKNTNLSALTSQNFIGLTDIANLTINQVLIGSVSGGKLIGGKGNDKLVINGGINVLKGGEGHDIFAFNSNLLSGTNTIEDFNINEDKIDLTVFNNAFPTPIKDFANLVMVQSGSDAVITLGSSSLVIKNVNFSNLTINNFIGLTDITHSTQGQTINGTFASETLTGGLGDDVITGGGGSDKLIGGKGNDKLIFSSGGNTLEGGEGRDIFVISSNFISGTNTITDFNVNEDKIDLTVFNNAFPTPIKDFANLVMVQSGSDAVITLGSSTLVIKNVNFSDLTFNNFIGLTDITHSTQNQTITGTSSSETLIGGYGDDVITGGGGSDRLVGGRGNDKLIVSGGGNILEGGEGGDTFVISSNFFNGTNTIQDFNVNEDKIDLTVFNSGLNPLKDFSQLVMLQNGNDVTIALTSSINLVIKNTNVASFTGKNFIGITDRAHSTENQTINGTFNSEILVGGLGNDIINGNNGVDTLIGNAGDDILNLGSGNGTANGGDGNDILTINQGDQILIGGAGNDIFKIGTTWLGLKQYFEARGLVFTTKFSDTIQDFNVNEDKMDLTSSTSLPISFADLQFSELNGNTILKLPEFQHTVTLNNVSIASLSENNFIGLRQPLIASVDKSDTNEDSTVAIDVFTGATNALDNLSITSIGNPAHGTVAIILDEQGKQKISYTPNANFNGTDQFNYTISDGKGGVAIKTLQIVVNSLNDAPTATVNEVVANEDSPIVIDVLAGASDVDLDPLSIFSVSGVNNGAVNIIDGKIIYTPDSNYNGQTYFNYTITDGKGGFVTKTIGLTINAVNDAPTAQLVNAAVDEDSAMVIDVLSQANDVDGDILSIANVANPQNGVVEIIDGKIKYTPNQNFNGVDKFTYAIADNNGGVVIKELTVVVNAVNDAPVISNVISNQQTAEESVFLFTVPQNIFSDVDGEALTLTATLSDGSPLPQWLVFDGNNFRGTPTRSDAGNISVKITATDNSGAAISQNFTLVVNNTNHAPDASDVVKSIDEDSAVNINLLSGASDIDGDVLSVIATTSPQHGTLQIVNQETGDFKYIPNADFNGSDSFDYTISDGNGGLVTKSVNLNIVAVNDAPTILATIQNSSMMRDTVKVVIATDTVATLFADVDGDALTYSLDNAPAWLSINSQTGEVTSNNPTEIGNYNVEIIATDSFGAKVSQNFVIKVNDVNYAPTATLTSAATNEDSAIIIDVLAQASDANNDVLSISNITNPQNGVAEIFDGKIKYTPNLNFNGTDKFNYTISDGYGGTVTQELNLTIAPVNDAPTAMDIFKTVDEEYTLSFNLSDISDVDGDVLTISKTNPQHASIFSLNQTTRQITYIPKPNFNGSDSFTYTVKDPSGASVTKTVYITVNPVNDAPVAANPPSAQGSELGEAINFSVKSAFTEVDGENLSYSATLMNGGPLPDWLKFDKDNLSFSGLSSTTVSIMVKLTAFDQSGKSTSVNFSVGSESGKIINGSDINDNLNGGAGNDVLYGGLGNDTLNGGAGNDYLYGEEGNDIIYSSSGDDYLYGGSGDDNLSDREGNNFLDGGDGRDIISSGDGNDTIYGGSGNDNIDSGGGDDFIDGGEGNDFIHSGDGNDIIYGGGDFDQIYGEGGDDQIFGGTGEYSIYGGEGNDLIDGTQGRGTLDGQGGNDILLGGSDKDSLYGGDGNDVLYGNGGNDYVTGQGGDDVIDGGDGNDLFMAEAGNDTLTGGKGSDTFYFNKIYSGTKIITDFDLNNYADKIDLSGVANLNNFSDLNIYQQGADSVIQFAENYKIILQNIDHTKITENSFIGFNERPIGGNDANYVINGSQFNDTINPNDFWRDFPIGVDVFYNSLTINGGAGDDLLNGWDGNDKIFGGSGNDKLNGRYGNNLLTGGEGSDQFIFAYNFASSMQGYYYNGDFITNNLTYKNVITDFDVNDVNEKIILDGVTFDKLSIVDGVDGAVVSYDTKTKYNAAIHNSITLLGIQASQLSANNFSSQLTVKGTAESYTNSIVNVDGANGYLYENGTGGDDIIYINAEHGDATSSGKGGNDIFVIDKSPNNSITITDFNISEKIDLRLLDVKSFADLQISQNGADSVVTLADSQSLILKNISLAAITTENFIFPPINHAPLVVNNISDKNIDATGVINISVSDTFTELDGEALSYSATLANGDALPSWLIFNSNNLTFSGSAPAGSLTLAIKLTAFDESGNSTATNFNIMTNTNSNPPAGVNAFTINGSKFNDDYLAAYSSEAPSLFGNYYEKNYIINGNDGDDNLSGMNGNDILNGGSGNDTLYDAIGNNIFTGGSGIDNFKFGNTSSDRTNIITDFNPTNETITFDGVSGVTNFADLIFSDSAEGVVVSYDSEIVDKIILQGVTANQLTAANFKFNTEIVDSGSGNYDGDSANNIMFFQAGNKVVNGYEGDDSITSRYGEGNNIIHGGAGNDEISYAVFNPNNSVVEANEIYGDEGNDNIHVYSKDKFKISGGSGNDVIDVSTADSEISGGEGDDEIYVSPLRSWSYPDYVETLFGGNNEIHGDAGNDMIYIQGGSVDNTIFGDGGNDIYFITKSAGNSVTIADFEINNSNEKIVLADFDLKFSDLQISQNAADTIIDLGNDQTIILKNINASAINENNFIFKKLGTSGNDEIIMDDPRFTSAKGGEGDDKFIIKKNPNSEIYINDFESGNPNEKIIIKNFPEIRSFSDILIQYQIVGGGGYDPINGQADYQFNALINLGDGQFINIENVALDSLDESNFAFDFSEEEQGGNNEEEPQENNAPTSPDVTQTINEDDSIIIDVLASASDIDGDILTLDAISNVTNGEADIIDGKIIFVPNADFNGSASLDYVISDGKGGVLTKTLNININPVNDAPQLANPDLEVITLNENDSQIIDVLADAFDIDGDVLTISEVRNSANGIVEILEDGKIKYTPNHNFSGTDSFVVVVSDGQGGLVEKSFDVVVEAVNHAPEVFDITATTLEDNALNINLLENASDSEGDILAIDSFTLPQFGNLEIINLETGEFKYTPNENFNGSDSFEFTISDGNGELVTKVVNLNITSVNDAPVIVAAIIDVAVNEDETTTVISAEAIAASFADVDDNLIYSLNNDAPSWLSIDTVTGKVTSTNPSNDDVGSYNITITATDASNASVSQNFVVTVNNVNDAPTAQLVNATVDEDSSVVIDVLAQANDVDAGDVLSIAEVTNSENGIVEIIEGKIKYTPNQNFNGVDKFSYTISDNNGGLVTKELTVIVNSVNDAPTVENIAQTIDEDNSVTIDVLANAVDIDGDILTIDSIGSAQNGSVEIIDGKIKYTPNANYFGSDNFEFTIKDSSGAVVTKTVTLNINSVNDAPTVAAIIENVSAKEDEAKIVISAATIAASFVDVDDNLTYSLNNDAPSWLSIDTATGEVTSTNPTNSDVGNYNVTIIATDSSNVSISQNFVLTIENVNDAPTIADISNQSAVARNAFNFQIPNNVFADIENDALTVSAKLAGGEALPSWLNFDSTNYSFSGISPSGDALNLEIMLTVSDGLASTSKNFILNIATNKIFGAATNDILTATQNDEEIYGYAGIDTIDAGAGNDVVIGGAGADKIDGGVGNDTSSYVDSTAAVTVNLATARNTGGYAFGDVLTNIENISGSLFNDNLTGNSAINILSGDAGDDTLNGGAGADTLDGGAGIDTASYVDSTVAVNINLATNANSGGDAEGDILINIENISASAFNDSLVGDGRDNILNGNAGDDVMEGGAGADTLNGSTGIDTASYVTSSSAVNVNLATNINSGGDAEGDKLSSIENVFGSAFDDVITGSSAANTINANDGNDIVNGGSGADIINGGNGNDTSSYSDSTSAVTINLKTGKNSGGYASGDVLTNIENILGSAFNDNLTGDANRNIINGGAGNDVINGGLGADVINGGTGLDTASYVDSTVAVNVNLATNVNSGGDAEGDELIDIENITGSAFDDIIYGNELANTISGNAGNDLISGGAGADIVDGGTGSDSFTYINSSAAVNINLATNINSGGDAEGDKLTSIENIFGSVFADNIVGNNANNIINGNDGNDYIDGGAGVDTLDGGNGSDFIIGGTGADKINGGDGIDTASYVDSAYGVTIDLLNQNNNNGGSAIGDVLTNIENISGSLFADKLTGDDNNNTLKGDAGNDLIRGGKGADTLIGDAGNDQFIFHQGDSTSVTTDVILDFVKGEDKINLSDFNLGFSNMTITHGNSETMIINEADNLFIKLQGDIALTDQDFIWK